MEKNHGGGGSSESTGDVQEQGEWIKGSIKEAAFCCDACTVHLSPPIFQCPGGHLFCSSCRKELPEDKCTFGSVRCAAGTVEPSLGMERAVESILVGCRYAERGCTEKVAFCYPGCNHWLVCPHAPCECPEPGCGFAGNAAELRAHLAAGLHKWPSTTFRYWVPFDLRIAEPGTHLLRCSNDGQLFLVSVQPAGGGATTSGLGLAVSLVSVEYLLPPASFQGSVSFSYDSARHRGTSTWELRPLRSCNSWPPTDYICVVPSKQASDGQDDAGIVITVNITCIDAVDEEDDLDDSSYVETDEDDMTSDED